MDQRRTVRHGRAAGLHAPPEPVEQLLLGHRKAAVQQLGRAVDHRRERGRITSRLDSIPGVGDVKRKALLRRFGSVAGVREASVEELTAVPGIGAELARTILDALEKR